MPRIPADHLIQHLTTLLTTESIPHPRALRLAQLLTQASADGVYSHGIHRVPALLNLLRAQKITNLKHNPTLLSSFAALQRYDGHNGLGPLNAEFCIDRAMDLATTFGIGCVALRNTRHWGRPGNCGWRAAEKGFLAICFTNAPPSMPAWPDTTGTRTLGNNPIVFAAPNESGAHLVLDMALTQFSFGKLETYRAENQPLPVPGGTDSTGTPTTDPAAILNGGNPWPIGFWKGSGLAILLDTFSAILSDGDATHSLPVTPDDPGISQIFIALQPNHLDGRSASQRTKEILEHFAHTNPESRYPGESALAHRRQSEKEGVYVRDDIWRELA